MATENLLIEIGTEELPPKALRTLAQAFADNFSQELDKADLAYEQVTWFAAPRRLALKVDALATAQSDKTVEKRGPAVSAAFDADGNPTKAAQGWARANGLSVEQAQRLVTDKGEWLLHKAEVKGLPSAALIPAMANAALSRLPIPKPMRWGSKRTQFIRPVHTVALLLGETLIEGEVLDIASKRTIRGHRFMGEAELTLDHADNYLALLEQRGKVKADYQARKEQIRAQVEAEAAALGGKAELEESLLEEVTSLVEWPVVLVASFEEKFLDVPAEALIYTMKGDQKYFPVFDGEGKLMPRFIFVSNIESKDPSQVIAGNEKVVRPRLADAEFFFNTDKKRPLASRVDDLNSILFQQQLGTLKEKAERLAELAAEIAEKIGANRDHAYRAGLLAKADLVTNMVMEFPEVQGTMGMHYARHDGESEHVAEAIFEQYLPRFSGDILPASLVGSAVAIADKLDTLVGIFGIGQLPKGDKDPFALRRAAIGLVRIITEKKLPLDLHELLMMAALQYDGKLAGVDQHQLSEQLMEFLFARIRAWYLDAGVSVDVLQAVLARKPSRPADLAKRIHAVSHFRTLDAATALAAANKRVSNILAKYEGELQESVDPSLLQETAEQSLAELVATYQQQLEPRFLTGDYQYALSELAALREPVDAFFEEVMVMAEDEAVKVNRLTLLSQLRQLFLQVADISALQ